MTESPAFERLRNRPDYPPLEMQRRADEFLAEIRQRRSVRSFSHRPVPRVVIERCIAAAATAPSGANLQPWHFAVVSDQETKRRIRLAAEAEEHAFYHGRAPQAWLDALQPLGTDEFKPFLECAPYLIAVFRETRDVRPEGGEGKNYYSYESVGIAVGILLTALHHCGLATLTHTPSPMQFLNEILQRPKYERPYLLLVVGYPAEDACVPVLTKKPPTEITTWFEAE